jgi:phosphate transport system substrate-binding protein
LIALHKLFTGSSAACSNLAAILVNVRKISTLLLTLAAATSIAACGGSDAISGAGATFPQPVYDQWAADLKASEGITVNYNPIGSGGGIAQLTAGTVNFGASDVAMDDEEMAAAEKRGSTPVHIPSVFGSVAVAYNLPGAKNGIRLDGETLAAIFAGRIARWNDPAIARLNPGAVLPGTRISTVHRADQSGTTKLFTSYLAGQSAQWEKEIGSGKSVKWPVGTGAAKNAGVAGAIKLAEGTIGYVELAYALQNKFKTAALVNSSGRFIAPTLAASSAAGRGIQIPADLRFSSIDSPNPDAYPIASATFLLVYKDMCKAGMTPAAAAGTKAFIDYGLGGGQAVAKKIGFAPLPPALLARTKARAAKLTCDGRPLE